MISSFDSTIHAFHSFYFEILTEILILNQARSPQGKLKIASYDFLQTKLHLIVH